MRAELERLVGDQPGRMPLLRAELSMERAIAALQAGDGAGVSTALARTTTLGRELGHDELLWHCARARAICLINAGRWQQGASALSLVHDTAGEQQILDSAPLEVCRTTRTRPCLRPE